MIQNFNFLKKIIIYHATLAFVCPCGNRTCLSLKLIALLYKYINSLKNIMQIIYQ